LIEGAKVPVLEAIAWVAFVGHHLLREGQQLQASPALRAVLEQLLVVVVVPVLVATLVVAIPQPNGRIGIPDLDVKALLLSPQPQVSFPAQLPELRFLRDLYIVGTRVHAHLVVLLSAHGVQAKVLIPHILEPRLHHSGEPPSSPSQSHGEQTNRPDGHATDDEPRAAHHLASSSAGGIREAEATAQRLYGPVYGSVSK